MTQKKQQPKYRQSETGVIKRSQINFAPYNPRKEDPEVIRKLKKNFMLYYHIQEKLQDRGLFGWYRVE